MVEQAMTNMPDWFWRIIQMLSWSAEHWKLIAGAVAVGVMLILWRFK